MWTGDVNLFGISGSLTPVARGVAAVCMALAVAGCAANPGGPGRINDPYEEVNRRVFANNIAMDRAVIRPVSKAFVDNTPPGLHEVIGNFATNFSTPGMVVNDVLQMRAEDAFVNTIRFAVNSTLGLAGLIDVAGVFGVPARETDFGETLHFWQVEEGAYLVLPVRGPTTQRDAFGSMVDMFLNPLRYVLPVPERYAGTAAKVLKLAGTRGRFSDTVDGLYYESADPYAQARSVFLQKRRYELGGAAQLDDPYAGGEDYVDPYLE